ncbi:MAG: dihydropteroate synthase [Fimbriimonadaceae bacterium]|jgi:dihydropteroate synthase|nr:dihydropteroate synthase [Fimbriimonadaceae bacterium]
MGILNVTPDSFSDGGVHFDPQIAIDAAIRMMEEGADLIDVGGESTRPGSEGVSTEEELRRVMPVVKALAAKGIPVSIDTAKASVAREALAAGAVVVNDVTAFSDPAMATLCAKTGAAVCLMHMKGTPRTMQVDPWYEDVVEEVRAFLVAKAICAEQAGIAPQNIWIDPGIGFGKTVGHNLTLLRNLERLEDTGYPVLIGTSRKSFIGKILGAPEAPLAADQRLEGTLATQMWAQINGARIIRAHDVPQSKRAIKMIQVLAARS